MGRKFISWWEGLPGRAHVLLGIPVAFVVLFLFHVTFFPLLDVRKSLMYAAMECVPIALVLAWATQNELRRRQLAAGRSEPGDDGPGVGTDAVDPTS